MAWQAFKQVKTAKELHDLNVVQQEGDPEKEVDEQVALAVKLAGEIIGSGAIGAGESFHVFLAGNANAGHTADSMHPGAQHDTISVAVTTAAYPGHTERAAAAELEAKKAEIERQRQDALAELEG